MHEIKNCKNSVKNSALSIDFNCNFLSLWVTCVLVFIQPNGNCTLESRRDVAQKSFVRSESCPTGAPGYLKEVTLLQT